MPPERIVGGQSFTLAPYIARLPQVEVVPASGRVVRTVGQAKARIAPAFQAAFDYHCKMDMPLSPISPGSRADCLF